MTQKPPKFTGTVDLDDEEGQLADHTHDHGLADGADELHHEHDLGPDEFDEDDDIDLDADIEARKRRAKLVFYGATALASLLIVFVGYHQFAPMFRHQGATTPVAVKAPSPTQPSPKLASDTNGLPPPPANPSVPAGANMGAVTIPAVPSIPASAGMPAPSTGVPPNMMAGQIGQNQPVTGTTPPTGPSPSFPAGTMTANGAGTTGAAPNPMAGFTAPTMPTGPTGSTGQTGMTPGTPSINTGVPPQMQAATTNQMPGAQGNAPAAPTTTNSAKPTAIPSSPTAPVPGSVTGSAQNGTSVANPASNVVKPAPMPGTGQVTGNDPRVDDLVSKVASLQASQKVTSTQLQQIQASLDGLQKQLGQVSVTPTTSAPAEKAAAKPKAAARHAAHEETAAEPRNTPNRVVSNWVLRSATPNGALLGHSSTGEVQRVAVGDVVTGLGRITYIGERDGRWVVQGANGSVRE
jgi:hypothetical protein